MTRIKIVLFISALLMTGVVKGQDTLSYRMTFNHLALSVTDSDRSASFYKTVLNLTEITNWTKADGIRWFSLGDHKELHLISVIKEPVTLNKAVHLALTTADFDAFVNKLKAENIPFSDWPGTPNKINIRPDGIRQVFFQDPDGYWIEVNSVGQPVK